jgi:hypothetical protein
VFVSDQLVFDIERIGRGVGEESSPRHAWERERIRLLVTGARERLPLFVSEGRGLE